jgi:hypothetical protein
VLWVGFSWPHGPGKGFVHASSSSTCSQVLLGKIRNMRSSGAVVGLVVVASFSVEGGRPTVLIQPTAGSGGVASGENRASTRSWRTMMASSDVVTFVKASSMVFSSSDLGCSGGNPRSETSRSNDGDAWCRYPS